MIKSQQQNEAISKLGKVTTLVYNIDSTLTYQYCQTMTTLKLSIPKNKYGQIHSSDLTDKEWEHIKDSYPFQLGHADQDKMTGMS